ncbi:MAG: Crp/Fnr family transcriptional regulator [Bacilli bacterium]|nr:Crp/Fnr family transcriptional regulator [Bacilli bacterium]
MTNIFENIQQKNILKLKQFLRSNTIKYPKNVNILSNVNQENFISIIEKGHLQLIQIDYNGNQTIIEELKEGDILSSTTTFIQSDEIISLTKEETIITYIDFNNITNNDIIKTEFYIIFIKNILKILNEQLANKNKRIELLSKHTTRDKLLEYFKMISKEKKSKSFLLPITYTELSNYLSVDRSAMMREISYLKEDNLIKTNKRKITIFYE